MCATFTKQVMKIFLLLALGCSAFSCAGYTYVQAGVESNFLIDNERVLFAQSDGSLTGLSLGSGDVLFRNKTRDFSGSFQRIPQGILLFSSQSIALLDPIHFTTEWETSSHFDPNITDQELVTYDGNGHV